MRACFAIYGAVIRNSFLVMLAYRLRYVTGILNYLLFVSVNYFIWQAIYSGQNSEAQINGFTMTEMVTYIAVGWIARSLYFSNIDYDIDDFVRTGQISTFLLRPVDFQWIMIAGAVGEALFRLLFFTLPIGIVIALAFPVTGPASGVDGLMFCLSSIVGFMVLAQLNFLTGLLAFSFDSIQGIIRAKYYLTQLCSGLILPLAFFPPLLRVIIDFLPFKTIAHVPLQFYLGRVESSELMPIILNQFFWLIALYLVCRWGWNRAVRKITLQGG